MGIIHANYQNDKINRFEMAIKKPGLILHSKRHQMTVLKSLTLTIPGLSSVSGVCIWDEA